MSHAGLTKRALANEQRFTAGVEAKLHAAEGHHAELLTRFEVLCGQSELPPGTGQVVTLERLREAEAACAVALAEVGRLRAVKRECARRLAEAEAAHDAALVADAWGESSRLGAEYVRLLDEQLADERRVRERAERLLTLRKTLVQTSPGFRLCHPLAHATQVEMVGNDFLLALHIEVGGRFHGQHVAAKPEDSHTSDVAQMLGRERAFIRTLSEREMQQGMATNGNGKAKVAA